MCVMSMIMDHYQDKWQPLRPHGPQPYVVPGGTGPLPMPNPVPMRPAPITDEEINEFRRLLDRAREYDRRTGQPDCELDEKRQALKKLAEELGVKLDFL